MARGRTTRLSSKNQTTIPVAVLRESGVRVGDELIVHALGPGEIRLLRTRDRLRPYAGVLHGVYERGYLKRLRDEWR